MAKILYLAQRIFVILFQKKDLYADYESYNRLMSISIKQTNEQKNLRGICRNA